MFTFGLLTEKQTKFEINQARKGFGCKAVMHDEDKRESLGKGLAILLLSCPESCADMVQATINEFEARTR